MDHEEQLPPPDWSCEPLDSLADVRFSSVDKKTTPGERPVFLCNYTDVYNDEYITGDEAFMRASATPAEISTFGLRRGDVVITKDSETPDDIGIPTAVLCERQDLICGYHLALIRPDLQRLDPLFLAKQIRTNRIARYFGQQCNGLTRYGLPTIAIEHAPIWLPKLPEQQQIGIVLSRLDATIRETARVVAKLKLIKNGLLHDLLTLGVDDTGAIRAPDQPPGQFVASPIGRIPRSWEYCRLFSHIDFPQGQVSPLTHPYRDWQLIAPDHIESGTGRLLAAPTAQSQ